MKKKSKIIEYIKFLDLFDSEETLDEQLSLEGELIEDEQ